MQRLLVEVEAGRIDVVVVYKVDGLTRSLADFAKLVELFDRHGTSFVSVTQAFNTTNSMGRLTLNVLLSFAQFEREVTSERIRDKIAASKRKGMRVGGPVPLGYEAKDKKLMPHPAEAEQARLIFRRYLDLGSLTALMADLDARGMVTKASPRRDGTVRGGPRFGKGGLAALLRNRCYIGEVVHKGRHYPGEHAPIVDAWLFDAVQAALRAGARREGRPNRIAGALLKGLIFDDRGNRMTPSTANKGGARYRYYVSCCLAQGRKSEAGSRPRVPAQEIEALVLKAFGHGGGGSADEIAGGQSVLPFRSHAASPADDRSARTHGPAAEADPSRLDGQTLPSDETAVCGLATRLETVVVEADRIVIVPRPSADGTAPRPIAMPWPAVPRRRRRGILHASDAAELRPIRADGSNSEGLRRCRKPLEPPPRPAVAVNRAAPAKPGRGPEIRRPDVRSPNSHLRPGSHPLRDGRRRDRRRGASRLCCSCAGRGRLAPAWAAPV